MMPDIADTSDTLLHERQQSMVQKTKAKKKDLRGRPESGVDKTTLAGRIGARARHVRQQRGMTLHEVASKTEGHLAPSMISEAERGLKRLTNDQLAWLCQALGCKITALWPTTERPDSPN